MWFLKHINKHLIIWYKDYRSQKVDFMNRKLEIIFETVHSLDMFVSPPRWSDACSCDIQPLNASIRSIL